MKLLMLTPRFPFPPNRGDLIRAWGELKYLAARHDVWLLAADRLRPSPEAFAVVRAICREVAVFSRSHVASLAFGAASLMRGRSLTEGYFGDRRIVRLLKRWSNSVAFDAVLTFSSAMAPYSSLVAARRHVLDMNDVDSVKWEQWSRRHGWGPANLYRLEGRRLADAERRWVREHDLTVVVNRRERTRLVERTASHAVAVVRTGAPPIQPANGESAAVGSMLPEAPIVGLVGSMSYAPNVRAATWFARWVWPEVRRVVPRARWLIVGRDPTGCVRRLRLTAGVTVTGAVDDVSTLLRSMRVFIAPIQDELGVQTKLIEAMAHGRPAVVTPQVADGMDWRGDPPFLIAADPFTFAECVVRLLHDGALANRLARAGQATVREFYECTAQASEIERLLIPAPLPMTIASDDRLAQTTRLVGGVPNGQPSAAAQVSA